MTGQYDYRSMADEEHRRTELLRLDTGMAGCGCAACQEFYRTIDLSVYGSRVKRQHGVLWITGRVSVLDDDGTEGTTQEAHETPQDMQSKGDTTRQVSPVGVKATEGNMSTVSKPGPKPRDLPEERIRRLADSGMGAKAIARELGGIVSYRTILRVLSGQRVLEGVG